MNRLLPTRIAGIAALAAVAFAASVAYAGSLSGPAGGTELFLDGSGSGFSHSGEVFLGATNGSIWCDGYVTFNADSSGNFSSKSCVVGPSNCPCGTTYTVLAYDYGTGTYSNAISFSDFCPF